MNQKPPFSRRAFAAWLAATPVAAGAFQAQQPPAAAPNPNTSAPSPQKRQGTVDGILPFQDPIRFTRKDVPARVQPFPMTQVRLLPSSFLEAAEWNRGYMSRLPPDRLLHLSLIHISEPTRRTPISYA